MARSDDNRGRRYISAPVLGAYRAIWIVLFALAAYNIGYGQPRDELRTQRLQKAGIALGITVYANHPIEGLLFGAYGIEGKRIGFRDGDLLTSIDGWHVGLDDDAVVAAHLEGPAGSIARMNVRQVDGTPRTFVVRRDLGRLSRSVGGWGIRYELRRWIAFAVSITAGLASLAAALLLFRRSARDRVAQLLSLSLVLRMAELGEWLTWAPDMLRFALAWTGMMLLTLAVLLFPTGRLRTGWQWLAIGGFVIHFAAEATVFHLSVFSDIVLLTQALAAGTLLLAVGQRLRRTPPGIARQQTKSVLFGVSAFCGLQIVNSVLVRLQLIPTVNSDLDLESWVLLISHLTWHLSLIAIPAGLLVSLLRFRLYDTETAISRSVALGALTLVLLAVFAGSEKIIEVLSEGYLGEEWGALSSGLAAAIAAATIAPLHHRISGWAERRFQGNLVHLRHGLPVLVGDLRETASPAALAEAILSRVDRGVRAKHGAVVSGAALIAAQGVLQGEVNDWLMARDDRAEGTDRLQADRADPLFPLRVPLHADGVGLAGWLLLGPRPDGSFYGKDERETLAAIADPIARALAIARDRAARLADLRAELDEMSRRQLEVEAAVERLSQTIRAGAERV